MNNHQYIKNIVLDIIFTILTFGLFNIWVQYRQIKTVNAMLRTDKYSFIFWVIFCICTFGLYHVYHEYIISEDIAKIVNRDPAQDGIINLLLTLFGFHIIADAIQQHHINNYFQQDTFGNSRQLER